MTLDEKIDQLNQVLAGVTTPAELLKEPERYRGPPTGRTCSTRARSSSATALQRQAVEKSRLGIPAIFGADVIHGYRTIFPIPLASACSWNPELVRGRAAAVAAAEAKRSGVDWTFAPMIDLAFDPALGPDRRGFWRVALRHERVLRGGRQGFQGERSGRAATRSRPA